MAIYHNNKKIVKIYHGNIPITRSYHGGILIYKEFNILDYNLLTNSDLLIDSDSNNVPDGFTYLTATDISLVNGIAKFTATARFGQLQFRLSGFNTQTIYLYARVKADSNLVRLSNAQTLNTSHSGSGQFEFLSLVETLNSDVRYPQVHDYRTSDWTPIEVDCLGAINITDLVSRGILPQGLTNAQYKEMLDSLIQ